MSALTDRIIEGINKSPIEDSVKKALIEKVKGTTAQIERMEDEAQYIAPEVGYEHIMYRFVRDSLILPVLSAHKVLHPNGRDTTRYVYAAMGFEVAPENFEVTVYKEEKDSSVRGREDVDFYDTENIPLPPEKEEKNTSFGRGEGSLEERFSLDSEE